MTFYISSYNSISGTYMIDVNARQKVPEFATIYSRPHTEKISPPCVHYYNEFLKPKSWSMVKSLVRSNTVFWFLCNLGKDDNLDKGKKLIDKILNYRFFDDEQGKWVECQSLQWRCKYTWLIYFNGSDPKRFTS